MNFSAENTELWNIVIQFGIIAAAVLVATFLRRKLPFIRNSLMPIAVLAGFLLLILRSVGLLDFDTKLLEMMTYHGIAIGFIALSLRIPAPSSEDKGNLVAAKSGALIVSTYLLQALLGFAVVLALAYTFMPGLFKAAGILLPMGYGQGPGQANNVGTTYEALGFAGGRSFALALAAAGYLCACIVGVIYLNILDKKDKLKKVTHGEISGSVNVDAFEDRGEIPVSESVDRFSMQVVLVIIVYLATYLVTWGITSGLAAISPGLSSSLSTILWGFNFIIGSALAMLLRVVLKNLRNKKIMTRQYQNNYLLSRISGVAFDMMIVAGIASIDIGDLSGLWVPFLLMAVAGGVATLIYLQWLCKKLYPGYYHEGLTSMYGMLTGTISSGILLLREIDPQFETPAANNLITGSSTGILFGIPMLIFIGMAAKNDVMLYVTIGIVAVYWLALMLFITKVKPKKKQAE
ncbi:MAG: sodium:glutamate symporter [Clostridiales bacterium]|nr:sodium:glutamate symporter [Clostridiales bacterium]